MHLFISVLGNKLSTSNLKNYISLPSLRNLLKYRMKYVRLLMENMCLKVEYN
jgi:hypothetical protein